MCVIIELKNAKLGKKSNTLYRRVKRYDLITMNKKKLILVIIIIYKSYIPYGISWFIYILSTILQLFFMANVHIMRIVCTLINKFKSKFGL